MTSTAYASAATDSQTSTPYRQGLVIYGPPGCGKSTHAAALAAFFGKSRLVDDWVPGGPLADDTIALTNELHLGALQFAEAMSMARITARPNEVGDGVATPAWGGINRSRSRCIECNQEQGVDHVPGCRFARFAPGRAA